MNSTDMKTGRVERHTTAKMVDVAPQPHSAQGQIRETARTRAARGQTDPSESEVSRAKRPVAIEMPPGSRCKAGTLVKTRLPGQACRQPRQSRRVDARRPSLARSRCRIKCEELVFCETCFALTLLDVCLWGCEYCCFAMGMGRVFCWCLFLCLEN